MRSLISNYYDEQTGWTIIEEIPSKVIFSPLYTGFKVLVTLAGICLLIALLVSYTIAQTTAKPLLNLCKTMACFAQGNFEITNKAEGYKEVKELSSSFNKMVIEIKELLVQIKDKEKYKRKVEMDFLRSQINPHFLYNTLFSIKCLVDLDKNKQASYMMSAFSDLLKTTLSVDKPFITLQEEIESIEKYIKLQNYRYDDKIYFEYDIGENMLKCLVPPLILQPIVENAIFHGIEPVEEGGMIAIGAIQEGDKLIIEISDDGVGMTAERLMYIKSKCSKMLYNTSTSIGMTNIASRIKLMFGKEYGVEIESHIKIGTTVKLVLPSKVRYLEREDL